MTSKAVPSKIPGAKPNFPTGYHLQETLLTRLERVEMENMPFEGREFQVSRDEYDTVKDVLGTGEEGHVWLYGFKLIVHEFTPESE